MILIVRLIYWTERLVSLFQTNLLNGGLTRSSLKNQKPIKSENYNFHESSKIFTFCSKQGSSIFAPLKITHFGDTKIDALPPQDL